MGNMFYVHSVHAKNSVKHCAKLKHNFIFLIIFCNNFCNLLAHRCLLAVAFCDVFFKKLKWCSSWLLLTVSIYTKDGWKDDL